MKSELPKGLHQVCGLPLVEHVGRALKGAGVERPVVVVGYGADEMKQALGSTYEFVVQSEQLGTGHAVMASRKALERVTGPVLVVPGDTPLITSKTLVELVEHHRASEASLTMVTCSVDDAAGYGRIVRDSKGDIVAIVEHKDCTEEQRKITEINAAVYCFDCAMLLEVLPELQNNNAQGEYYLTDAVSAFSSKGYRIANIVGDSTEFAGVNDRWHLALASESMQTRILASLAASGVTIADPRSTSIEADVEVEPNVSIGPCTVIAGGTRIAKGTVIGPNCWIKDSVIGADCRVVMSHLDQVTLADEVRCGPFANIRPGTKLGKRAKIGNFVEVKNSTFGTAAFASHLAYVGDAEIGDGVNIGAGTITCNYDGFAKHRTVIGAGAFVGSNATLIAPINIGAGAVVAAGSVISEDVPADALAIGRSRQELKEQWAKSWRKRKTAQS